MMCKHVRLVAFAIFGLCLTFTSQANAWLITAYGDRESWEQAVFSFSVERFDSAPVGTFSAAGGTFDVGDFSITVDGHHGLVGIVQGLDGNIYFNGDLHIPTWQGGNHFESLNFDGRINAFAVDLSGLGDDCPVCSPRGGLVASIGGFAFDVPFGTSFFGVVADFTFADILFTKACCERDYHHMDNVSYRSVPEPSVFALVLLGLTGVAFARRTHR